MSMRFETEEHLKNEQEAITMFCDKFKAKFEKLGENDIDYLVTKGDRHVFVEIKGRNKHLKDAYPLPIAARKVVKLSDKGQGIIIWNCFDAIIYGNLDCIKGGWRKGGRPPRQGAVNDSEVMMYLDKQDGLVEMMKKL
jgi:Holliday junction resolvase-like predicted endonuclease